MKHGCEIISWQLASLFNLILKTASTPAQWSESIIILLYKKGNPLWHRQLQANKPSANYLQTLLFYNKSKNIWNFRKKTAHRASWLSEGIFNHRPHTHSGTYYWKIPRKPKIALHSIHKLPESFWYNFTHKYMESIK